MILLLTLIVHLNYFCSKSLSSESRKNNKGLVPFTALFLCCCSDSCWVNFCCVTNLLRCFTLEIVFILVYFYLFMPPKALSWSVSEFSKSIQLLWSFYLVIATILLSAMLVDSSTWSAIIGVCQSTEIMAQSNSFQIIT